MNIALLQTILWQEMEAQVLGGFFVLDGMVGLHWHSFAGPGLSWITLELKFESSLLVGQGDLHDPLLIQYPNGCSRHRESQMTKPGFCNPQSNL